MNIVSFINSIFKPIFDFCFAILNYNGVGGIPFWRHILTLYMVAFVIRFISHGSLSFGIGDVVSTASRKSESRVANRVHRSIDN